MGGFDGEGGEERVKEGSVECCALFLDFEDAIWGGVEGEAEAGHVGCVAGIAARGVNGH